MGFPKEKNRVNFHEHKFGVMLIMLSHVSTKYSKHHNNHHLNANKVAMLRRNTEISPNNTMQQIIVALLGTIDDSTLRKAYYRS